MIVQDSRYLENPAKEQPIIMATDSLHFLSGKRIVVAGAGVAGLAFAIGLRKQWPSTSPPPTLAIYERDTQDNAIGREGYSLSLRSDHPGGLQALQKLGILDEILAACVVTIDRTHGAGFCLWDRDFKELIKIASVEPPGLPVGGARIARNKLRTVLVDGAGAVGCEATWGVAATAAVRRDDGRLEVQLSNGEKDVCDLLIAADGANSRIRAQLRPDDKLTFRRVQALSATSRFDGPPPEPVNRDYGMVLSGTGTALFVSPVDDRSAVWSLSWYSDVERETKKSPVSADDAAALLAEARTHLGKFPPLLGTMIDATDPATLMTFNAKDKAPFRHTDEAYPDVIFLGDANHAVSPFAGNGANVALNDGWDIARLLCSSESLREAVKAYDDVSVPRSTKVWKQSHFNISMSHSTGWKSWFYVLMLRLMALFFFRQYRLRRGSEQK